MRPVNLIPKDQRRGERAAARSGPLPYILLAVLVLVLGGTVMYVKTSASIDDRRTEIASLEAREAAATQAAQALAPYTEFATLAATREATVSELANSRFDWERVLNELALVIPGDVWLTSIIGTASPEVQVEGGTGVETRAGVPGPALEIIGCGVSQDAVAGFVAALRDIDGVTRVGLDSSALPETSTADGAAAQSAGSSGDDCRTRDFIAQFQLVIAFDEAPVTAASTEAVPTPTDTAPTPADPENADAQAEQQQAKDSAAEQTDKAQNATNIVPGVSSP